MFPVMLHLQGMRVLVVGGGPVGQRKAKLASDAGAEVLLVDPKSELPLSASERGPGGEVCVEPFSVHHLDGIQLAFACATAEVNTRVVEACRARGIWVCDAIVPERGTFILPSVVNRGDLKIAISTGGASPSLAKQLRKQLEVIFDESYGDWVRVLGEVRDVVLATVPDPVRRKELFEDFSDRQWLEFGRSNGWDAAKEAILELVRKSV